MGIRSLLFAILLGVPVQEKPPAESPAPPPSWREFVHVGSQRKGARYATVLQREDPKGAKLGVIEIRSLPRRVRAAGATLLLAYPDEVVEVDREGKVLFRHSIGDGREEAVIDCHKLPNNNYLVTVGGWGKGRSAARIVELDSKGAVVRKMAPAMDTWISSAWPIGLDRILVAGSEGIQELDWKGAKLFKRSTGGGMTYDAAPAGDGKYLVARKGKGVVEMDRTGRTLRHWDHDCPMTVQLLPDGGLLVSGG